MLGTTSYGDKVSCFFPSRPFFFSMTGGAVTRTPPPSWSPSRLPVAGPEPFAGRVCILLALKNGSKGLSSTHGLLNMDVS